MPTIVGSGALRFEPVPNWAKLPAGWELVEVAGVAVDSKDNVYVFNRGEHPIIVFSRDGEFQRSWGEGMFSPRPHGIHICADDLIYCVDDGSHAMYKFSAEGKLLMTIGTPNCPAPKWSGKPFHRPTHVAVSPRSGNLYVTDGYGNSAVHKYSGDGRHLQTWGSPGIDAGQFMLPHNIVIDNDDNIYVADRESHRIQVFDANGKFMTMWNNIHRPDGICLDSQGNFFIGEINGIDVIADGPALGHRISVYDLQGRMLTRFGDPEEGEGDTQFIAPHGVATDSRGDLYVGDVSYTVRGQHMKPPRYLRCLRKFARVKQ